MVKFYTIIHKLMWEVLGVGWIKCGVYSILQRPMWMLLDVETNMKTSSIPLKYVVEEKNFPCKDSSIKEKSLVYIYTLNTISIFNKRLIKLNYWIEFVRPTNFGP